MKKNLLFLLVAFSSLSYGENITGGNYDVHLGDGYQTILPCFRFNITTPNRQVGKFEYALLSNGKILQKGIINTNDSSSNYIQWCSSEPAQVQQDASLHNIVNKYSLVINGISFRNLKVGTSIDISSDIKKSVFNNGDFKCHHYTQAGWDCRLSEKNDSIDYDVAIKYNDILATDNVNVKQSQFGTEIKVYNPDGLYDPRRGSFLTFQHSNRNTDYSFSIFRKMWLTSNLIIPSSISNYHSLNTRNLKLSETINAMDYSKILHDNDDYDTYGMIDYNFHRISKDDENQYFAGFCSGIGVINNIMYASCRDNVNTSGPFVDSPKERFNLINQIGRTYLSYKTACITSDYDYNGQKTKVALLKNDSNGALRCESYKPDFPQGEYLNSCTGINYDPTNRTLTTDCYDNNNKLINHVTKLGVMGSSTPHYKNVNGSLVAY